MVLINGGIVMIERELHRKKAPPSMVVSDDGSMMVEREVHP